jgi:hypothetical protein
MMRRKSEREIRSYGTTRPPNDGYQLSMISNLEQKLIRSVNMIRCSARLGASN